MIPLPMDLAAVVVLPSLALVVVVQDKIAH